MPQKSILIIAKDFTAVKNTCGRLAYDLAQTMVENFYTVSVITTDINQQGLFVENKINIHRVKKRMMPLRYKQAAKKIDKIDIVISLTQSENLLFIANGIAKKFKAKHIQWVQEIYPEVRKASGRESFFNQILSFDKRYLKAQKKCDYYVVPGRAMQQKLKEHHILPQKISYIPNWTNLNSYHLHKKGNIEGDPAVASDASTIKRDDNPKFRIIHAGEMGAAYPIKPVIDAAELLKTHTEIEFLFIGDSQGQAKLARERDKRELDNIRFIPYQPTGVYKEILESGDVHLITMRPQFNSLLVPCKFYSSIAVGRPVIYLGDKESEIGRVITQYGCGDIIEQMNAKLLCDMILKYRHDGQYWFNAQEGAVNASQQYTPAYSFSAWADVLNKVL